MIIQISLVAFTYEIKSNHLEVKTHKLDFSMEVEYTGFPLFCGSDIESNSNKCLTAPASISSISPSLPSIQMVKIGEITHYLHTFPDLPPAILVSSYRSIYRENVSLYVVALYNQEKHK